MIVRFMSHHFQSHFDLPTDLSLNMMKTSNLDLMMVNCLSLHLWLIMDTRGFDEGNDLGFFKILLMVLIKVIMRFHLLVTYYDHLMKLHWSTMVEFLLYINMVYFMGQHWLSNLDILMSLCLLLMKA